MVLEAAISSQAPENYFKMMMELKAATELSMPLASLNGRHKRVKLLRRHCRDCRAVDKASQMQSQSPLLALLAVERGVTTAVMLRQVGASQMASAQADSDDSDQDTDTGPATSTHRHAQPRVSNSGNLDEETPHQKAERL